MTLRRIIPALTITLAGALGLAAMSTLAQSGASVPGAPLAGITAREFEEFRLGLDDFLEVETSDEGLGPLFNGTSCAGCHSAPAIGGISPVAEVRVGRLAADGQFTAVTESGETLMHLFSIPTHACQAAVPPEANVVARRVPIPLFGAGLVEAIEDDTLIALEDPTDRNRDGVSGRAAVVTDLATGTRRVGRFGWKAQHATLLAFGADAYRNEMGITSQLIPTEAVGSAGAERMRLCDRIPDPEDVPDPNTGRRGIDNFASFMRLLAPAGRGRVDAPTALDGERVFGAIGCTGCHVPTLRTGAHASPALDRRNVPLFSDLLLHDVGTGDGIQQAAALPRELRTPALWGLRFRRPLLHDGSAPTIDAAVRRHDAEARTARDGYERLSERDSASLLVFLNSL